jgi:hypothetical protein
VIQCLEKKVTAVNGKRKLSNFLECWENLSRFFNEDSKDGQIQIPSKSMK